MSQLTNVLRSVYGRLLGLDNNDNLVMRGSKIYFGEIGNQNVFDLTTGETSALSQSGLTPSPTTAAVIDFISNNAAATVQYNSSTLAALPITIARGASSQTIASGGPYGGAFVRIVGESGATGKARLVIGDTTGAAVDSLWAPTAVPPGASSGANLGWGGFWVRINAANLDNLDGFDPSGNGIALDMFSFPSGKEGNLYLSYLNNAGSPVYQTAAKSGQWVFMPWSPFDWSAGAAQNFPLSAMYIGAIFPANDPARTSSIDIGPAYMNIRQRPTVSFGFDNNDGSHFNIAFPYMQARGIVGNLWSSPSIWNTSTNMTRAQITQMYQAGWYIGLHGNLYNLTSTTGYANQPSVSAVMAMMEPELVALEPFNNGQCQHMAWPLGMYDPNSIAAAQALGILSARATGVNFGPPFMPATAMVFGSCGTFATNVAPSLPSAFTTFQQVIQNTILYGCHTEIWGHSLTLQSPLLLPAIDYVVQMRDAGLLDIVTAPERYARFGTSPLF